LSQRDFHPRSSLYLPSGTYLSYTEAVTEVVDFARLGKLVALAAVEIGGGNGMINMITGSELDIPVVDGDFMGRAYPTGWQVTMNVYDKGDKGEMLLPSAMASGDGSVVVSHSSQIFVQLPRRDGNSDNTFSS